MMEPTEVLSDKKLVEEVARAPAGEVRRSRRFVDVLDSSGSRPEASVSKPTDDEAQLQVYYRLMQNEAGDHFELLALHFEKSRKRSKNVRAVLVAHDPTELGFAIHDEPSHQNLSRLSKSHQGCYWHPPLAIIFDRPYRAPSGLVASQPFVHQLDLENYDGFEVSNAMDGTIDNEQRRWIKRTEESEEQLEDADRLIHVLEPEPDDYLTLFPMSASGYSFVVRITWYKSVCEAPKRCDFRKLSDRLEKVDWRDDERSAFLSLRPKRKATQGHPVSRAWMARLKAWGKTVDFRPLEHIKAASETARLEAIIFKLLEMESSKGEQPVHWLLVTKQPIETDDNVSQVVD